MELDPKALALFKEGYDKILEGIGILGFDIKDENFADTAARAAKGQVHVVGVSSLAAGHLALVPALKTALGKLGLDTTMIVVGGVIPNQDFAALREAGAEAIFPPGTVIAEAAQDLLERLNERLGYRQRAPV